MSKYLECVIENISLVIKYKKKKRLKLLKNTHDHETIVEDFVAINC
jgi:hypothetical protein